MTKVELAGATRGGRIGTLGPLVIGVYDGPAEPTLLDHLERVHVETAAKYGRFTSLSIVATPKVETPTPEYRARSTDLATRFQQQIIGTAIVILSTGAAAVIARTFLVAYSLVVRTVHPQQTFRQLAPAVKFVQELPNQLPELKNDTELQAAIEAFIALKP